ncbi:MAG: L-seryl-tRNA(Sec) selenium transferase [Chloroflexi bacterium]|nr:L-seryl-tRNA(Sec) selenium transferase [Chloroflexota bacterium]
MSEKHGVQQTGKNNSLRRIPSVDKVLGQPALDPVRIALPRDLITEAVRDELNDLRDRLRQNGDEAPGVEEIARRAVTRSLAMVSTSLHPVINATGVVLHTNLGRAPLSQSASAAIEEASAYNNLEYNLAEGERASRYSHAVAILRQLTGCEDAVVVNNNAAALVLVLAGFAQGKEVILARGQSVEIGGGFRIPDVMRQSGARLIEVGTTNRTYLRDYEEAITQETAIIIRVHASNFRIIGFTTEPDVEELTGLAHKRALLMVDDVGSGALLDTTRYGLKAEPMVQASIKAGVDLVLFSGDKLLGGPQCGVIAGRASTITRLKKHPLLRALRVDKLTLAGLQATLLHYLKGEAEQEVPVWRMISMPEETLRRTAEEWVQRLNQVGVACKVVAGQSAIGGGSLPGETLPTWLVAITPGQDNSPADAESRAGRLAATLRRTPTHVIARIEHGVLLLDPRTVLPGQEEALLAEVAREA